MPVSLAKRIIETKKRIIINNKYYFITGYSSYSIEKKMIRRSLPLAIAH